MENIIDVKLLDEYITSAVNLYGLIKIDDFLKLVYNYENVTVDKEYLIGVIHSQKSDYYFYDNGVIVNRSLKNKINDEEFVNEIINNDLYMNRYMPDKYRLSTFGNYFSSSGRFILPKVFSFIRNKGIDRTVDNANLDDDLSEMFDLIKMGTSLDDVFNYFVSRGYKFNSEELKNKFIEVLQDTYNNIRMYKYKGYTYNEIKGMK